VGLSKEQVLQLIRTAHTLIYTVMVTAIGALLFAGITGYCSMWLWIALGLVTLEGIAFFGDGMRCPLTALAVHYGAEKGHSFDTLLPERFTRYTFRLFGSLTGLGLLLLALRWGGVLLQPVPAMPLSHGTATGAAITPIEGTATPCSDGPEMPCTRMRGDQQIHTSEAAQGVRAAILFVS
jgi:hypothetical protein